MCRVYTIGHSNHSIERLIELLAAHDIRVLVDARSQPYSRYSPQFNLQELRAAVTAAGLRFLYLGKELGGRPDGAEFYDEAGYVLYSRVAESPLFLSGIRRLEAALSGPRAAILCSEENPAVCHRHLLVGRVLAGRGVAIRHVRGDGRVQTDDDLLQQEQGSSSGAIQLRLFEEEEAREWKSLRSVLPTKPPPSSSTP